MSGKLKKIGASTWIHDDLPSIGFSRKPPEWILDHLMQIYTAGFRDGERHVQGEIADALDFLRPAADATS